MTEQQQQIVDLLIAEFNKSNKPKPTGFARIAEATSEIDEWLQLKKRVMIANDAWDDARDERIHEDFASLKEQIESAGITVSIHAEDGRIELNCNGYNVDERITIRYRFDCKFHKPKFNNDSVNEYNGIYIEWHGLYFKNIEQLFQSETFFTLWTQLVNKSILIHGRK